MSAGWSWFVIVLTLGSLAGCVWLLIVTNRRPPGWTPENPGTGHVWDEDLAENNHPLPRWWIHLFYLTIAFAVGYLALYPGLGNFVGLLGWSSAAEVAAAEAERQRRFDEAFGPLRDRPLAEIAGDEQALRQGRAIFLSVCAGCHGSDGRGARGYPDLTDDHWLWGGDADAILASVLHGRTGVMPAWGDALGPSGVTEVAMHVRALAGLSHDVRQARAGARHYQALCVSCHGPEGKGMPALGAPDLTRDRWVHGGTVEALSETIARGRQGVMPAHEPILGPERARLAAAYVYARSRPPASAEAR